MRQPDPPEGRVTIRGFVEWLVLVGLPIGAVLSATLMLAARLWLKPIYEKAELPLSATAALTLSWGWNLACVALPLLTLYLTLRLTRSTALRVLAGFVLFHLWLALFLFTLVGVAMPLL
jgi:hypothetical protein